MSALSNSSRDFWIGVLVASIVWFAIYWLETEQMIREHDRIVSELIHAR